MRFLTPVRPGDVFVIFGSGSKVHVVQRDRIYEKLSTTARCGRKGRKVSVQAQHSLPPNIVERYAVCADCREFARGTDG